MHCVFHRALVLTLAFALVASAAAWRQCNALQLAAIPAAIDHGAHATGHHADAANPGEHDHHAMHSQHAAGDPVAPAADDHGCMKCCAMCTVAIAVLPVADAAMNFEISSRLFSRDPAAWTANQVAVDPGIPKRSV